MSSREGCRIGYTCTMLFGVGSADLPVAIDVRRGSRARLALAAGGLGSWLAEHRAWLRPRIIPAAAALAAIVLVLVSLKYMAGEPVAKKRNCVFWRPFAQYEVDDRGHRIGRAPTRQCRADPGLETLRAPGRVTDGGRCRPSIDDAFAQLQHRTSTSLMPSSFARRQATARIAPGHRHGQRAPHVAGDPRQQPGIAARFSFRSAFTPSASVLPPQRSISASRTLLSREYFV